MKYLWRKKLNSLNSTYNEKYEGKIIFPAHCFLLLHLDKLSFKEELSRSFESLAPHLVYCVFFSLALTMKLPPGEKCFVFL